MCIVKMMRVLCTKGIAAHFEDARFFLLEEGVKCFLFIINGLEMCFNFTKSNRMHYNQLYNILYKGVLKWRL